MFYKNNPVMLVLMASIFIFLSCQRTKELSLEESRRIVDTCLTAFTQNYIYPDTVPAIEKYIEKQMESGNYSHIADLAALTKKLKSDFRMVTNDRHIWIDIMENLPVAHAGVSREEIIKEKRKNNFGFVKFEMLPQNVAFLQLDGFNDLDYARETAIEAMANLSISSAIILDLRNNHGGHGNMVAFIASYFFEDRTQLNSLYFREADSLAEAWTDPRVPGEKLVKQKLYILSSINTTSAAESFSYTMKHYNRATIIGRRTRGAAHWKETYKFPHLGIFLEIPVARPISPVTGKGWEGEGVQPDINIAPEGAKKMAYKLALENL